uniref:phycytochrome bilisome rod-core linker protein n=1 Tax=Erythrolobus coxiae TaxID=362235 RepID=UPI001FCD6D30|nr:phycytochrome bilisome rod-core linker protein [Erythrolobus coxiae]UNJ17709.1 phycytochrome bilisome rod-core linker protein [Erythrolobus coxiae]
MSLPILQYSLSTQNQRVESFEVTSTEEQPRIYTTDNLPEAEEMDAIIWAAYRQIFSEHQILAYTQQPFLESQLRFNQITVRDFIRGLATSPAFLQLNYDVNNNYRMVEMYVQRILGRDVYNEREKLAWAIVIASKGVKAFVDMLTDSEEYLMSFGDSTVPYQKRRIIAQRTQGEMPFNLKTPRYGADFKAKLGMPQFAWASPVRRFRPQEQQPKAGDPALFLRMVEDLSI